MLTLQDLKAMPPFTIFASGITIDNSDGINMTNSGKELRWVAKRGGFHDWCIYIHLATNNMDFVASYGDKILNEDNIKKLVQCDDESYAMYRY